MNRLKLKADLQSFLNEDLGWGDLSSECFSETEKNKGYFVLKEDGVVCGLFLAPLIYDLLGGEVTFTPLVEEGHFQTQGTIIAEVYGPIRHLLAGERLILNLWQRMGGIATATQKAVTTLNDEGIKICDTRKTVPGLRMLDKYAVTKGGGWNHRMGLDDGVMLKDNHIAYAGGISQAIELARQKCGHMVKIEIEVETLAQFKEAVAAKPDVIMLDNRTPAEIKDYLKYNQNILIEVSGGISLQNLASYRGCGADCLSLGYLTHSVTALDISFNSCKGEKNA